MKWNTLGDRLLLALANVTPYSICLIIQFQNAFFQSSNKLHFFLSATLLNLNFFLVQLFQTNSMFKNDGAKNWTFVKLCELGQYVKLTFVTLCEN